MFKKNESIVREDPISETTPKPIPEPTPEPIVDQDPVKEDINWHTWTRIAMQYSSEFEGKGGDWGNPVSNFDGAGLTCGLLGFTWKWNNQPPMVLEFVKRYGEAKLFELMPKTGHEYLLAAKNGEHRGMSIVKSWSSGLKVIQPYRQELNDFWSSEGMKQIQIETSQKMFGNFAKVKCLESQKYFNLPFPKLAHFCYWFDQAVLNGQGKTVPFRKYNQDDLEEVIEWCGYVSGYNVSSIRQCKNIWKEQVKKASDDQKALFIMAYERAQLSRKEFMGTVMSRRGTLALGCGVVNEKYFTYNWRV